MNELFTDYSQTAVASSKQRFNEDHGYKINYNHDEDTQNKKVCFTINDYYQPRNYVSKILTHQAAVPLLHKSFSYQGSCHWNAQEALFYHFYIDMHQKAFGGRAPPGPAGGAIALPQTPSRY